MDCLEVGLSGLGWIYAGLVCLVWAGYVLWFGWSGLGWLNIGSSGLGWLYVGMVCLV